ncbi:MAG TPA: hypothetical protein VIL36_16560 [Acidimicrobiales bacterium]
MRFPHFFHHRRSAEPPARPDDPATSTWADHPAGSSLRPSTLHAEAAALVDELEAWLRGDLAERRAGGAGGFPTWIVLNRLAHAELPVLRTLADGDEPSHRRPFRHVPTWAAAEQALARRIVGVGDAEAVAEVQRQVLVPLELQLIDRAQQEPLTLGQVVSATTKALGQHHPG